MAQPSIVGSTREGWHYFLPITVPLAIRGCLWANKCRRRHIAHTSLPFVFSYAVLTDAVTGFTCLRGHMFKSSLSSVGSWRVNRGEQDNRSELANNQIGEEITARKRTALWDNPNTHRSSAEPVSKHRCLFVDYYWWYKHAKYWHPKYFSNMLLHKAYKLVLGTWINKL